MSRVRWLGEITSPPVSFPGSTPPPKDKNGVDLYWPCNPNSAWSSVLLRQGTRYRFIVFAPTTATKLQVEIGVGNAGFFSGDLQVQICSSLLNGFQPSNWSVDDPKTLLWQDLLDFKPWCVEATYISTVSNENIKCARAVGCWSGWGDKPPCENPATPTMFPPVGTTCTTDQDWDGTKCIPKIPPVVVQPVPATPTSPTTSSSGSGGLAIALLIGAAAIALFYATLGIKPGPAPARYANPRRTNPEPEYWRY